MNDDFTRDGTRAIDPLSLLRAYAAGIFPMGLEDGSLGWFSPDPRGILPLDGFHIPKGLRRALKKHPFEIRYDTAFAEVLLGCADRASTWIDPVIFSSYNRLHELGFAHSVEAWHNGRLVGGLYGVALRGLFCGESMFSRETDASKICLVHLVERLRRGGFVLLDTQWTTPHLRTFGAIDVPRDSYLDLLQEALETAAEW
ncbi:MAG: leucyl/phenylalanyl-tRNA--protein transferase [Verrucomicrobiales bacterium]